jgi:TonB family protein
MSYVRPFNIGGKNAREYSVGRVSERGHVYVCADGSRVYVVAALGAAAGDARLRQFVDSFAFKGAAPARDIAVGPGRGVNVGRGDPVDSGGGAAPADDDRPFRQSEVTKKAVITFKPEPGFTEWARRFNVTGVVRLRAILHSSGEMRNISVVKTLPHGLTGKSLAAARQMRFEPAQKDGRAVSQYVVLEYNFNIY